MTTIMEGRERLAAPFPSDSATTAAAIPVPTGPRRRHRIDRRRVASLLAEGCPVGEVAAKVGCSRQHVWRLMRKSAFLGRALAEAEYEVGREADGRLAALRPAVADALKREIDAGNVRVLLWLADRLGLGAAGYTETGEDQPEPLPPAVSKELMTLRRDLEWYRSELDRRDEMEDLMNGDGDDGEADVA